MTSHALDDHAAGESAPAKTDKPAPDDANATERVVRCLACKHPITKTSARIEMNGAHEHEFTNPQAYTFRVACYRDAPGALGWGDEEKSWTWFAGYTWRVILCTACGAHVGWSYRRPETAGFVGLAADRVTDV